MHILRNATEQDTLVVVGVRELLVTVHELQTVVFSAVQDNRDTTLFEGVHDCRPWERDSMLYERTPQGCRALLSSDASPALDYARRRRASRKPRMRGPLSAH